MRELDTIPCHCIINILRVGLSFSRLMPRYSVTRELGGPGEAFEDIELTNLNVFGPGSQKVTLYNILQTSLVYTT